MKRPRVCSLAVGILCPAEQLWTKLAATQPTFLIVVVKDKMGLFDEMLQKGKSPLCMHGIILPELVWLMLAHIFWLIYLYISRTQKIIYSEIIYIRSVLAEAWETEVARGRSFT